LAADFQLSILGTITILVLFKYPKLKPIIFTSILSISLFICGYVTYINELEPLAIFSPETLRNQLFKSSDSDKSYFDLYYAPTHTNLGTYFVGLAAGYFYFYFKKCGKSQEKTMVSNNYLSGKF
jgi:hypothetical protein